MTEDKKSLSTCGCCAVPEGPDPGSIINRPGLSALAYRVGTHGQFKAAMKNAISKDRALDGLTVRDDKDFSTALLDAWAVAADVLSFYQERIANEGYLRTATERLSLLHQARLVGYRLNPGVAAGTYLAFRVEEAAGALGQALQVRTGSNVSASPPPVTIETGAKAQSVPGPGEEAQTFETIEEIEARAEWNAIKPRPTQPQKLKTDMGSIILEGTATNLKAGDIVMVGSTKAAKKILKVTPDNDAKTTRIDFASPGLSPSSFVDSPSRQPNGNIDDFPARKALDQGVVTQIIGKTWKGDDLEALVKLQGWKVEELADNIAQQLAESGKGKDSGVFVFRQRAFPFGYNAVRMPIYNTTTGKPVDPVSWQEWETNEENGKVYLDNAYDEIIPGGYLAIQKEDESIDVYPIKSVNVCTRSDYGISSRTTLLSISSSSEWWDKTSPAGTLAIRGLTLYTRSESMTLAEVPIDQVVEGDTITLDGFYPGLKTGQIVILTGEREDLGGVYASEVKTLKEAIIEGGFTIITFDKALTYTYLRSTVTINANVARATHGETVTEILGSGDATQVFQVFTLRQPPLTYVSAASADGTQTTLQVRVNDLLWEETDSFYGHGPGERIYITRVDNNGKTYVRFGDGITGARLPTGQENVKATYRKGIGLGGLVKAGQLSNLMTRPFGVKEVTNPLAPSGAADPETVEQARQNTPLTVLTLDRVVSLKDFEDFVNAFAGIDKARADWVWVGETRLVYITAAGAGGEQVDKGSTFYQNLVDAVKNYSNGLQSFCIGSYVSCSFYLKAKIRVDTRYIAENVVTGVKAALEETYSFAKRQLAQPVTKSEVLAIIQGVEGVEAVDLDELYLAGEVGKDLLKSYLTARPGRWDKELNQAAPAELLTLAPNGVTITLMETKP
jgi:hypothetical protein